MEELVFKIEHIAAIKSAGLLSSNINPVNYIAGK